MERAKLMGMGWMDGACDGKGWKGKERDGEEGAVGPRLFYPDGGIRDFASVVCGDCLVGWL